MDVLRRLDERMKAFLPAEFEIAGYKFHENSFRISPTTAKKDRNGYMKELTGYVKLQNDELVDVNFE